MPARPEGNRSVSGKDKREAEARAREAALQLMDAAEEVGDAELTELCEEVRDRLDCLLKARWMSCLTHRETWPKESTEDEKHESKQIYNSAQG